MSTRSADNLDARLSERVFAPLASLRRRWRCYLALEGAFHVCIALVAAGLGQLLLDRWLRLSADQRAALNVALTVFWLWVLRRSLLTRLSYTLDDRTLAATVDRACPQLHDCLATAVQFAGGRVGAADSHSPQLIRAVLADACDTVAEVPFLEVLDHRRAARRACLLSGWLLVIVLAFVLLPGLMGTWFKRNWLLRDVPWPQRTYIHPVGFDEQRRRRVPLGDELEIVARVEGVVPTVVQLEWSTPAGHYAAESMTQVGRTSLHVALGRLREQVRFRIVGGDERTNEYIVVVVERPRVLRTNVRVWPPEYTGLEPYSVEQQTVLEVLAGGRVELDAWLNKPVRQARFLTAAGDEAAACGSVAADHVRVSWPEPVSGVFHFGLLDDDGWGNDHPVQFTLKVAADRPPAVRLDAAGVGELVTVLAELPLVCQLTDTYGLGSGGLMVQPRDETPRLIELPGFVAGRREFQTSASFSPSSAGLAAGDRLRLWVEAADQDPRGPNVGRSVALELEVVSRDDFLTDMARRELELRREFERLISAQRALQEATQTLLSSLAEDAGPEQAVARRLAGLARRQNAQAGRCLGMSREFEQILAEMTTNRVAVQADERRIRNLIVLPLDTLGQELMPAAATTLTELRVDASRARRESWSQQQATIIRALRAILANMLEWEGYRETIALLREIVTEQHDVRAATLEALERRLKALLELEEPEEPAPPDEPKP
ncbi:MAG: hypothetical protein KKB50_18775 [Planctomycetes bacterium]|nr:hypothetical protein [Planctomycetota bacterium]